MPIGKDVKKDLIFQNPNQAQTQQEFRLLKELISVSRFKLRAGGAKPAPVGDGLSMREGVAQFEDVVYDLGAA